MSGLKSLTPQQFENLNFDLVQLLGLKNCVWRTPGRDNGRDIEGLLITEDFSGYTKTEKWYIECKRYSSTVSWPTIWEKIAYAEAQEADVLLFSTSSTISANAVDEVNRWNESRKKPLVRIWNGQDVKSQIERFPQILIKYKLSSDPKKDGMASIARLTQILVNYVNTKGSQVEFKTPSNSIDNVIQALAELIHVKMVNIESGQAFKSATPFSANDSYGWLHGWQKLVSIKLDKYVARAILNMVHFHLKKDSVTIKKRNSNAISINIDVNVPKSLQQDIAEICFWGRAEIRFHHNQLFIKVNNE